MHSLSLVVVEIGSCPTIEISVIISHEDLLYSKCRYCTCRVISKTFLIKCRPERPHADPFWMGVKLEGPNRS